MEELNPLALDRELARAATQWRAWQHALSDGKLPSSPLELHPRVCQRATFQALEALPTDEPLRWPLMRWVYRLVEQRVNARGLCVVRAAEAVQPYLIDEPEHTRASLRTMLLNALGNAALREAWLHAALSQGDQSTAAHAELWERRMEVARRMDRDGPDELELPTSAVYDAARAWLADSDALATELVPRNLPGLLAGALGCGAEAGWPARLNLRSVAELVNPAGLLSDLELRPEPLPQAIGPASFLRALAAVGAAFVDATAPTRQPYAIAHDPYGLRRRSVGGLFALLPTHPPFLRRQLGCDPRALDGHLRALSLVVLIESRALAVRVLLRRAALEGAASYRQAFDQLVTQTFGVALDPSRAPGVLWRLRDDDAQRFCGLLLASNEMHRLVESHDEDWFRNPRAVDQLRSEAELSPATTTNAEALQAGAHTLTSSLAGAWT